MNLTDNEHKMLKMFAASKGLSIKDCIMSFFRERIENDEEQEGHSFEDFNEETQQSILNCRDKKYVNSLPTYDNVDDFFESMGIYNEKDKQRTEF